MKKVKCDVCGADLVVPKNNMCMCHFCDHCLTNKQKRCELIRTGQCQIMGMDILQRDLRTEKVLSSEKTLTQSVRKKRRTNDVRCLRSWPYIYGACVNSDMVNKVGIAPLPAESFKN